MTLWFTSDTHFNHANVIKHCARPFSDTWAMNDALIARWREKVKPTDQIFFLGDFCLSKEPEALTILRDLPGQKTLIRGNHDSRKIYASEAWLHVFDYHELKVTGVPMLVLCHYPFATWNGSHHGSINLHGHCHGTLTYRQPRQIDVGVDCWNYYPISLEQVMNEIQDRETRGEKYRSADHHRNAE